MDQKRAGNVSEFAGGEMKRSMAAVDEFLRRTSSTAGNNENRVSKNEKVDGIPPQEGRVFDEMMNGGFFGGGGVVDDKCYGDIFADDLAGFDLRNRDTMNGFSCGGGLAENLIWSQNLLSMHSTISGNIDSQSSICGISLITPMLVFLFMSAFSFVYCHFIFVNPYGS